MVGEKEQANNELLKEYGDTDIEQKVDKESESSAVNVQYDEQAMPLVNSTATESADTTTKANAREHKVISGDVSVSNNATIGGNVNVLGDTVLEQDLEVKGWVTAHNLKLGQEDLGGIVDNLRGVIKGGVIVPSSFSVKISGNKLVISFTFTDNNGVSSKREIFLDLGLAIEASIPATYEKAKEADHAKIADEAAIAQTIPSDALVLEALRDELAEEYLSRNRNDSTQHHLTIASLLVGELVEADSKIIEY